MYQSQAQNRVVGSEKVTNGHMCIEKDEEHEAEMKSASRANQRPASMYETREGLRKSPAWHQNINQVMSNIWYYFVMFQFQLLTFNSIWCVHL